jgi:hypothetical protein
MAGIWDRYTQKPKDSDNIWSEYVTPKEPVSEFDFPIEAEAPLKPPTRNPAAVLNDYVIEAANAVLGFGKAITDFAQPGTELSAMIEDLIRKGEESQSLAAQQAKRELGESIEAGGTEALKGVGRYALTSPGLAVSQAAGSFAIPFGAIRSAAGGARALGVGERAVEAGRAVGPLRAADEAAIAARAIRPYEMGAGVAVGAAGAGGDAAGNAYEMTYAGLLEQGYSEEEARATATQAAREASVVPAAIGGAAGVFGAERLLFGRGALKPGGTSILRTAGSEALQEAVEEGATAASANIAAGQYVEGIDPMKGVVGSAALGGLLGGITGGGVAALSGQPLTVSRQPGSILQGSNDQMAGGESPAGQAISGAINAGGFQTSAKGMLDQLAATTAQQEAAREAQINQAMQGAQVAPPPGPPQQATQPTPSPQQAAQVTQAQQQATSQAYGVNQVAQGPVPTWEVAGQALYGQPTVQRFINDLMQLNADKSPDRITLESAVARSGLIQLKTPDAKALVTATGKFLDKYQLGQVQTLDEAAVIINDQINRLGQAGKPVTDKNVDALARLYDALTGQEAPSYRQIAEGVQDEQAATGLGAVPEQTGTDQNGVGAGRPDDRQLQSLIAGGVPEGPPSVQNVPAGVSGARGGPVVAPAGGVSGDGGALAGQAKVQGEISGQAPTPTTQAVATEGQAVQAQPVRGAQPTGVAPSPAAQAEVTAGRQAWEDMNASDVTYDSLTENDRADWDQAVAEGRVTGEMQEQLANEYQIAQEQGFAQQVLDRVLNRVIKSPKKARYFSTFLAAGANQADILAKAEANAEKNPDGTLTDKSQKYLTGLRQNLSALRGAPNQELADEYGIALDTLKEWNQELRTFLTDKAQQLQNAFKVVAVELRIGGADVRGMLEGIAARAQQAQTDLVTTIQPDNVVLDERELTGLTAEGEEGTGMSVLDRTAASVQEVFNASETINARFIRLQEQLVDAENDGNQELVDKITAELDRLTEEGLKQAKKQTAKRPVKEKKDAVPKRKAKKVSVGERTRGRQEVGKRDTEGQKAAPESKVEEKVEAPKALTTAEEAQATWTELRASMPTEVQEAIPTWNNLTESQQERVIGIGADLNMRNVEQIMAEPKKVQFSKDLEREDIPGFGALVSRLAERYKEEWNPKDTENDFSLNRYDDKFGPLDGYTLVMMPVTEDNDSYMVLLSNKQAEAFSEFMDGLAVDPDAQNNTQAIFNYLIRNFILQVAYDANGAFTVMAPLRSDSGGKELLALNALGETKWGPGGKVTRVEGVSRRELTTVFARLLAGLKVRKKRENILVRWQRLSGSNVVNTTEGPERVSFFSKTVVKQQSKAADVRKSIIDFLPEANSDRVVVVQKLTDIDANIRKEVEIASGEPITNSTQGFVYDGKAYLIADNIKPGTERAVFMHEVGAHIGMENALGDVEYDNLVTQITDWAVSKTPSLEKKLAIKAMKRVVAAGTTDEQANSELVAYFIEEAMLAGVKPSADVNATGLRKLLNTVLEAFRRAMKILNLAPKLLTAQDLVAIAYGAAKLELYGIDKLRQETSNLRRRQDMQKLAAMTPEQLQARFKPKFSKAPSAFMQGLSPEAINQRIEQFPQPVRNTMRATNTGLRAWWRKGLNYIAFTQAVIKRAVESGIPSAARFGRLLEERGALASALEREVEGIADMYANVPDSERGIGDGSVNDFIYESTRQRKWGFQPDWTSTQVSIDSATKKAFDKLSPESQAFVKAIFKHGDDMLALKKATVLSYTSSEYDALIMDAIKAGDTTEAGKLRKQKVDELERFKGLFAIREGLPYAPIKRTGNYVVVAKSDKFREAEANNDLKSLAELQKDPDHYHVSFVNGEIEAQRLQAQLLDQGHFGNDTQSVDYFERENEAVRNQLYGGNNFLLSVTRLRSQIDAQGDSATDPSSLAAFNQMRKIVTDMYLESLAEASARKSEIRRRGVAGEVDMLNSFTLQGRADANFISAIQYGERIQQSIRDMRKEAKQPGNRNAKSELYNELMARYAKTLEFEPMPVTQKLTRLTSIWFLATSPGYYLQNLTQPYMMSLPLMAARHDITKSSAELYRAYKDLKNLFKDFKVDRQFDFSKVPEDVREAIEQLVVRSRIDIGLNTEMGQFEVEGKNFFTDRWNKVDKVLRLAVQKVESVNRLSTAIAAYRLELQRTNGDKQAALDYADQILTDTHGDYTAWAAPRAFNTNIGKVALQFRKFQLIQLSLISKLINESLTGKDRAVARKALAYILGNTAIMTGVVGMPGYAAIAWALGALFGDEDEPFNLEQTLREYIGDGDVANMILRGAPTLGGVDLSGKIGMGNMLSVMPFTEIDKLDGQKTYEIIGTLLGGPTGGLAARAADGAAYIANGDLWKGLEMMTPKGMGDLMKAIRVSGEGVTNRRGDVLLGPDDLGELDTFWRAIGLAPIKQTVRSAKQSAKYELEQKFESRSGRIKNDYVKAFKTRDMQKLAESRRAWMELQEARRRNGYKIQPLSNLIKAPMEQRKRERQTIGGVQFDKSSREYVRRLSET